MPPLLRDLVHDIIRHPVCTILCFNTCTVMCDIRQRKREPSFCVMCIDYQVQYSSSMRPKRLLFTRFVVSSSTKTNLRRAETNLGQFSKRTINNMHLTYSILFSPAAGLIPRFARFLSTTYASLRSS